MEALVCCNIPLRSHQSALFKPSENEIQTELKTHYLSFRFFSFGYL